MKETPNISTKLLFGFVVLLLLFISYLSYTRITELTRAADLVNHTQVVKLKLEEALTAIKDMEIGQRGFLLTRDSSFLEPYEVALVTSEKVLAEIDSLTTDNPPQSKNIRQLKSLIRSRIRRLNLVLDVSLYRNNQGLLPLLKDGKVVMNSIRNEIAAMQRIEDRLLEKRVRESKYFTRLTPLLVLGLSFLAICIVLFSFHRILKSQEKLTSLNNDLIQREQQLSSKNLELERANEELSSFNYVASHDLQEPLRKIQIFTKRVLDKEVANFSNSGKDDFGRIHSAAQRMQNLIESLLNYSRVTNKAGVFLKTDLNEILNEVKSDLQELIEMKSAKIKSQKLPVLQAVPLHMHQLFLNLISNAIKYAKPEVAPYIDITAERVSIDRVIGEVKLQGVYWEIRVQDNGIGFDEDFSDKIFEVFQRLHSSSAYEGTGIGLAICKKILQTHNGVIIAEGKPGLGATFTFFLPVDQQD